MTIKFFDSADERELPSGQYAALYLDGDFKATQAQAETFSHHRWITVLGDPAAGAGDYEAGNPLYDDPHELRAWASDRHAAGHRVRVYCDRADAARAAEAVKGIPHEWWISTLDGKPWTAKELAADLAANWRVTIDPGRIWANQYQGGPHAPRDASHLFGEW